MRAGSSPAGTPGSQLFWHSSAQEYDRRPVLVGRREELRQIGGLLAAVKRGRSGALVLVGEPGIGKSALLEETVRRARGVRIVRASGVESESELPYAGLLTLTRPVAGLVPSLPEPQAQALTAALALGPAPPADPLAVCAATLGLLAAAAEHEPVLAVLDDAHWLDPETVQAIGFAARRLGDERVAILIALREGEESAFLSAGLDRLVVPGLAPDEASELLDGRVATSAARRLAELTTGNALAMLELADDLSDGQRAGHDPIAEPLPVGEALERAFGGRLNRLPESARAAVVVAAAAGNRDDVATLERAWSLLGAGRDELADAERSRIVSIEAGRLRFRHPLVRAVAYGAASAPNRRAAHAALATVLDGDALADERAWHVALAAAGPDEEAAATIEAAGRRAQGRSRRAALRALVRAAALTPEGERRAQRELAAARAATEAGAWDEAAALLGGSKASAPAGESPAEHLYLSAVVASKRDGDPGAAELLERAAAELARDDPERAAVAEVQAAEVWMEWGGYERALAAAERASALPFERGGKTEVVLLLSRGDTAGWAGRVEEAVAHWRRAAELVDADDADQMRIAGEALFSAGDDDGALHVLRRAEWLARESATLGTLTVVLELLALSQTRAGDLQAAHAAATECVELMRAIGQRSEQAKTLGILAWIEAMLGRERECRAHVKEAHAALRDLGYDEPPGSSGVGLLELSLGRAEAAVEALSASLRLRRKRLDAEVIAPRPILPSLIEALARAGRREEAEALLSDRVTAARRTGRPHAIAAFLRCAGVLHADETSFREALEWHDRWPNRWERARTELCYGELLRRLKRRADARMSLRAALEGFEAVGAELWADRARAELRATGERARRRDPSTLDELTPQELQVAGLVATGLTNRDVAARLFLSPKTIETHLAHVFRKTGVRTRAELAHRFRDSPDSIAAPAS
jgi:DNA-binding CsgD family transcriptional regulator